ncbi:MAG: hypothetical protein H6613_09035 [Ignavibacteriales bacterium]|nr:hypothetical protein [Ignavibacteriales bacterium]
MRFKTKIQQFENNTGIEVSPALLEKLSPSKKPLVVVKLNGYSYRSGSVRWVINFNK